MAGETGGHVYRISHPSRSASPNLALGVVGFCKGLQICFELRQQVACRLDRRLQTYSFRFLQIVQYLPAPAYRRLRRFAEFERSMIRQRVKAGLKRAVAQGVKLGRAKMDSTTERKVRKQLAKGMGILKVAKSLGIGTGTVQRIANELR